MLKISVTILSLQIFLLFKKGEDLCVRLSAPNWRDVTDQIGGILNMFVFTVHIRNIENPTDRIWSEVAQDQRAPNELCYVFNAIHGLEIIMSWLFHTATQFPGAVRDHYDFHLYSVLFLQTHKLESRNKYYLNCSNVWVWKSLHYFKYLCLHFDRNDSYFKKESVWK